MAELNPFYTMLIRGSDLTKEELSYLRRVYSEYGRDKLCRMVTEKKILPFAARTFAVYDIDTTFWAAHLDQFRLRNQKILHCLDKTYQSLHQHGVRKMFVSENFGALLSSGADIGLFASGDVDNYADPAEKQKIYQAFETMGYTRMERYSGNRQIAAEFFPPKDEDVPENFYISVDFYPLARIKLPCFIEADQFVEWDRIWRYVDTSIQLPPPDALMYICMLHISLHSFSRAPDIRLYIDLLNMTKTQIDYDRIRQWCQRDHTCTRAAVAAELSNKLMKTQIPDNVVQLSGRRRKIEKIVFDPVSNDLIYEPRGLKVLRIEALCNDWSMLHGIRDILSPDKAWMKSVYGSCGFAAHIRHFVKVI